MKKNPRIHLEKTPENNKKNRHQNVKNKSKPNLKCTLLVLAHINYGNTNMYYLHLMFNKFKSISKHTDNLQVG